MSFFITVILNALLLSICNGLTISVEPGEGMMGPPHSTDGRSMQRSMYQIVWSCLSTIFICTWVSVHPNIPARGESPLKVLWTKIKLMLWTLVMPELIFTWALRQWLAARMIAKLYRSWGWSQIHGHFIIMGGFDLVLPTPDFTASSDIKPLPLHSENSRRITLSLPQFQELVQESKVIFPNTTVSEIKDKSRGDFLSKIIAVLQMVWFVVQCIARRMQGLALTQLELVTLALACLNVITSFFWWHKPRGVREPVPVYFRGTSPKEPGEGVSHPDVSVQHYLIVVGTTLHGIPTQIRSFFFNSLRNCGETVRQHPIQVIPLLPFYYLFRSIYLSVKKFIKSFGDVVLTNEIAANAVKVPTFYAPDTEMTNVAIFILLPIFATVFGALHCIGWNFDYATQVEQTMWRITSVMIMTIPFAILFILCCNTIFKVERSTLDYPAWALVIIYVLARSSLLVQALVLLRMQPSSAYRAVNWTDFLLHFP